MAGVRPAAGPGAGGTDLAACTASDSSRIPARIEQHADEHQDGGQRQHRRRAQRASAPLARGGRRSPGADEVTVTAAAKALDGTTAAAPLLALWGVGSFAGGLLITRSGGGARTAAGLALLLAALAAGHLALIPASGGILTLGAVLVLAGAAIAPAEASVYAMVDDAAPPGTTTEAFAWLASAMAVGGALGAAAAGTLIDHAGPTAAFALAGGAGALAVLVTALRTRTFVAGRRPPARTRSPCVDGERGDLGENEPASRPPFALF